VSTTNPVCDGSGQTLYARPSAGLTPLEKLPRCTQCKCPVELVGFGVVPRHQPVPTEVTARLEASYGPHTWCPELTFCASRVVFFPKEEVDRCTAWIRARKTGIARDQEGDYGNGWRKCHTENYWVYYAKDLVGTEHKTLSQKKDS